MMTIAGVFLVILIAEIVTLRAPAARPQTPPGKDRG